MPDRPTVLTSFHSFSRRPVFSLWCGYRYNAARWRRAVQYCVPGDARTDIPWLCVRTMRGVGINSLCTRQVGVTLGLFSMLPLILKKKTLALQLT